MRSLLRNDDAYVSLVGQYPRALAHLRQLLENKRLGLVLGAGVSNAAGLPNWEGLVNGVASNLSALGIPIEEVNSKSVPIKTQIMFSRFRERTFGNNDIRRLSQLDKDAEVAARWRKLVHETLYSGLASIDEKVRNHPYSTFWRLLPTGFRWSSRITSTIYSSAPWLPTLIGSTMRTHLATMLLGAQIFFFRMIAPLSIIQTVTFRSI